MKYLTYVGLLSVITMLTGCSIVRIQSNVKPDAKPQFRRILIVSQLPTSNPAYLPTFLTAFPVGYQICVVSSSPISFESPEEAIQRQRQTCESEVILTIGFNRNYTAGNGKSIMSYNELYLEMTSIATGKPFWKAIVTTGGNNEVPPREIISQLRKDGIITGNTSESD